MEEKTVLSPAAAAARQAVNGFATFLSTDELVGLGSAGGGCPKPAADPTLWGLRPGPAAPGDLQREKNAAKLPKSLGGGGGGGGGVGGGGSVGSGGQWEAVPGAGAEVRTLLSLSLEAVLARDMMEVHTY
jgi:hypothetical protein